MKPKFDDKVPFCGEPFVSTRKILDWCWKLTVFLGRRARKTLASNSGVAENIFHIALWAARTHRLVLDRPTQLWIEYGTRRYLRAPVASFVLFLIVADGVVGLSLAGNAVIVFELVRR